MSEERCEPADTMPDIISRLKAACYGMPYAKILWPHRLLHDAVAEIAAAKKREAGLAAENAKLRQFACRVCDAWDAIGGALETSSDVDDFNECEQATFELRSALDGETP